MAAMSVANIVKTSLGPVGLDKMLVDDVGVRAKSNFSIDDFYCMNVCWWWGRERERDQ